MSDRFEQLEMRRQQLLLRSERLRAEFGTHQRVVHDALRGVDRTVGQVKRFASPVLIAGGGLLLLGLLRRRAPARAARSAPMRTMSLAARGLAWVTLARRILTVATIARTVMQARRARMAEEQPLP